eukprot:8076239-Pyramimonas_sp.AAC.1
MDTTFPQHWLKIVLPRVALDPPVAPTAKWIVAPLAASAARPKLLCPKRWERLYATTSPTRAQRRKRVVSTLRG